MRHANLVLSNTDEVACKLSEYKGHIELTERALAMLLVQINGFLF